VGIIRFWKVAARRKAEKALKQVGPAEVDAHLLVAARRKAEKALKPDE